MDKTTILLSDSLIKQMIDGGNFGEFTFLADPPRHRHVLAAAPKKKARTCGGCTRKKRAKRQAAAASKPKAQPRTLQMPEHRKPIDFNAVKNEVLNLSEKQLSAFKSRLKCDFIRMHVKDHRGSVVRRVV